MEKALFTREVRHRASVHVCDESGAEAVGIAIYALSDPRSVRETRYIGQTAHPRRRWLQHLGTARLWLPDETPWWVSQPKLRPLYRWIRELYAQQERLPFMLICTWVDAAEGRLAERAWIRACLERQLPLLNVAEFRAAMPVCH
jgi:hypothetical protein